MKFNLKNRPKYDKNSRLFSHIGQNFEKWFEGFEAELREIEKKLHNGFMSDDAFGYAHTLIKEILGE